MARASEDSLGGLHDILALELIRRIQSGEATASDLGVARAFLRDNGIDAVPTNRNIRSLTEALPSYDEDEFDGRQATGT